MAQWSLELRGLDLLGSLRWDTDYPEASRTGPGELVAAAEAVFAADSGAAISQLAWSSAVGPDDQVLAVASMLDLAVSFTGGSAAGMRWITTHLQADAGSARPARALRDEVVRLACPAEGFAALAAQPGSGATMTAWAARRATVCRYAGQVQARQPDYADAALLVLLRGHHQRVLGPDRVAGQLSVRLARSAALAMLARTRTPA